MQRKLFSLYLVALGSTLLTAWLCLAAPLLPKAPTLPNEVQTLAGLTNFQIEIETLEQEGDPLNLPIAALKEEIEQSLVERTFRVVPKDGDALIRIAIISTSNPDHPDIIGFTIHLAVEQPVYIERFDATIRTPTYAAVQVGFAANEDLRNEIDRKLAKLVRFFLNQAGAANRANKRTPQ